MLYFNASSEAFSAASAASCSFADWAKASSLLIFSFMVSSVRKSLRRVMKVVNKKMVKKGLKKWVA